MGKEFNRDRFAELLIVGILRGFEVETVRQLVGATMAGGLRCIEVTMNSPSAVEAIGAAIEEGGQGLSAPLRISTRLSGPGRPLS